MKTNILLTFTLFLLLLIIASIMIFTKAFAAVKRSYTIAIVGDSMVDTMQTSFPYLSEELRRKYPHVDFKTYNYGVGSENIEAGLARFDKPLTYKDREFMPLSQMKPDIIVVGSWAYNPFSPHDTKKHKKILTQIVQKAKKTGAEVYMMKEIAPLQAEFGRGVRGVNWEEKQSKEQAQKIVQQLQNVEQVAREQKVGFIDIFAVSKDGPSTVGEKKYVNESDGILASPAGHRLTAQKIIDNIAPKKYNPFSILTHRDRMLWSTTDHIAPATGREIGGGIMSKERSIYHNIIQANNLTTSISALHFTKLYEVLESAGEYTVFIPNNTAYEKLPKVAVDTFFAPEQQEQSKDAFSFHIVKGKFTMKELENGVTLKTLIGKTLKVQKKYNQVMIEDVGLIQTADIESRNGIIHIIDTAFIQGEIENNPENGAQNEQPTEEVMETENPSQKEPTPTVDVSPTASPSAEVTQ